MLDFYPLGVPDGKPFRPSNGTEGDIFCDNYCFQCIHERWAHFMDEDNEEDKCEIYSRMMLFDIKDPEYPAELIYMNKKPTCTNYVHWDWGNDRDGRNEPPKPDSVGPNQLMFPFMLGYWLKEKPELFEMETPQ